MMLYECGVRYERTMENGMTKKVTELYLVDACSFAEAEGRITKEMKPYISGDFDVVSIKRTNYSEIVEKVDVSNIGRENSQGEETSSLLHCKGFRHQQCPHGGCRAHENLSR